MNYHIMSETNIKPNGGPQAATPQPGQAAPAFDQAKTEAATKQKPTVAHMLGEIVWLFSQSATHKNFAVGDLEWMVMPPLMLEQYRLPRRHYAGRRRLLGLSLGGDGKETRSRWRTPQTRRMEVR